MSRIVNVSGDYKLTVANGGKITLDAGSGSVYVNGDLYVSGTTTSVNSTDTYITDNIITLNDGELGSGISNPSKSSGFEVNRGTLPTVQLVFNENDNAFVLKTITNTLVSLKTNSIITDGSNLNLIGFGTAVISVAGTNNYELNVSNDDDIPNVKWVQSYVNEYYELQPPDSIKKNDSILRIIDFNDSSDAVLQLKLNDNIQAEFSQSQVSFQNLTFQSSVIDSQLGDLQLVSNENVSINPVLKMKFSSFEPAINTDGIRIYAKQITQSNKSVAGTGIYFVNNVDRDELISRRKALAYSMIF